VVRLLPFALVLLGADAQQEARQHFDRAISLSHRGEDAAALRELEEAYRISPNWQVLFNLGVVREKLGEPVPALHLFERYLSEGGTQVNAARRHQVEGELGHLRKQVGELVVELPPSDAVLEIDGLEASRAGPHYVMPGRHRVAARLGSAVSQAEVEVHIGERAVVALAAPPNPPATEPPTVHADPPPPVLAVPDAAKPVPAAAPPTVTPRAPAWYGHWYVWAGVGVVVAGAASVAYVESRPRVDVRVNVP